MIPVYPDPGTGQRTPLRDQANLQWIGRKYRGVGRGVEWHFNKHQSMGIAWNMLIEPLQIGDAMGYEWDEIP
jgi:hypothetical protein